MKKKVAVLATILIFSIVFWVLVEAWITDPTFGLKEWQLWAQPLAALLLLVATEVLSLMLLGPLTWRLAAMAIPGIVFMLVFGFKPILFFVPVLVILSKWYATTLAADEMRSRIRVHPRAVARRVLKYIILPTFLALAIVYSQNSTVQESADQKKLPPIVLETVEQISRQVVAYQAREQNLTPAQQQQVERAFVREIFNQINSGLRPYLEYFQYLPFLVGLGMFLVLWGFSFIYAPITIYLVGGLYLLLKRMKFITVIEAETKSQRVVPF